MNGLHLCRTIIHSLKATDSIHNKILFFLQKPLSNTTYNQTTIQEANAKRCLHTFSLRSVFTVLIILSITGTAFAQEYTSGTEDTGAGENRLISLLSGYLANDLQLQSLSLTAQSASLSLKQSTINNGIALNLSTGTMVFRTSSAGTSFTVEPSASVTIPEANNTAVSLTGTAEMGTDESVSGLEDVSIKVSTDIISGNALTRKVTLLKAERALLEAKRAVQDRAVSAEKEFYTELESLLTQASTVLTNEQNLYEDEVDFKTVMAQGYANTSSTYRTAELKVRTATRTLAEAKRTFMHDQTVFASKCGIKPTTSTENISDTEQFNAAWNFLPSAIPAVEGVAVTSFDQRAYTETESAEWEKYIGGLTRDADKNLTLSANAGYTFANSATGSNTVDTGLSLTWKGLTTTAGVSVPVATENSTPAFTVGFSFTPSGMALADIKTQQKVLDAKLEDITIASAQDNYTTAVVSQQTTLGDLIWSKQSDAEEYETYSQLEKDMTIWYKQGVVSESDYRAAQVNKEKARITCLVNAVEFIIYNDTTKLLFHTDAAGETK